MVGRSVQMGLLPTSEMRLDSPDPFRPNPFTILTNLLTLVIDI